MNQRLGNFRKTNKHHLQGLSAISLQYLQLSPFMDHRLALSFKNNPDQKFIHSDESLFLFMDYNCLSCRGWPRFQWLTWQWMFPMRYKCSPLHLLGNWKKNSPTKYSTIICKATAFKPAPWLTLQVPSLGLSRIINVIQWANNAATFAYSLKYPASSIDFPHTVPFTTRNTFFHLGFEDPGSSNPSSVLIPSPPV